MSDDGNNDGGGGGFLDGMERAADKYYEHVHDRIRRHMPGKEPLQNSSKPRSSQSSRGPSRDRRDRYEDDYRRSQSKRASSQPDRYSASGPGSHVHFNGDERHLGDESSSSGDGYGDSDDERRYRYERSRRRHRRRSDSEENSYVEEGRRRRNGESMGESTARGGYDATRIPSSQYAQKPVPEQPGYIAAEPIPPNPNAYQQVTPQQQLYFPPPPNQIPQDPPNGPSPYQTPPPQMGTYGVTAAGAYPNANLPYQQPPLPQQQVPPLQPQAGGSPNLAPPPIGSVTPFPPPPRSPSPSRTHKTSSRRDSKSHHSGSLTGKDHHMLAYVTGGIAGGFLGHQAGRGDVIATAAGAILGALGANLADEQLVKRKDKIDKYKDRATAYFGGGGGGGGGSKSGGSDGHGNGRRKSDSESDRSSRRNR